MKNILAYLLVSISSVSFAGPRPHLHSPTANVPIHGNTSSIHDATPSAKNFGDSNTSSNKQVGVNEPVKKLSPEELRRVKNSYDDLVLNGKSDPYPMLIKNGGGVAGPKGSNLVAMVKIKNSGSGDYYRRSANKLISKDISLQADIKDVLATRSEKLVIDPEGKKNPKLQKADGTIVALEWHHSPNHIGSLSLIPTSIHRLQNNKAKLHYDGKSGGNEMYNTTYK